MGSTRHDSLNAQSILRTAALYSINAPTPGMLSGRDRAGASSCATGYASKAEWGSSAMSHRAVQWEEGMFLRPHHFLAAQNHASQLAQQSEKWDHHHDWGLRSIDLDLDALANYRLVVRSLEARLRDGTLVTVPQDRRVSEKPLKEAFQGRDSVTVYIGLPVMSPGRPNISSSASAESSARYSVDN